MTGPGIEFRVPDVIGTETPTNDLIGARLCLVKQCYCTRPISHHPNHGFCCSRHRHRPSDAQACFISPVAGTFASLTRWLGWFGVGERISPVLAQSHVFHWSVVRCAVGEAVADEAKNTTIAITGCRMNHWLVMNMMGLFECAQYQPPPIVYPLSYTHGCRWLTLL